MTPGTKFRSSCKNLGEQTSETILFDHGEQITEIPQSDWEKELDVASESIRQRLENMPPDHHAVRNFAARELQSYGKSISIDHIPQALGLA